MPDDRRIATQLYERDYYAWAVHQAKALRGLAQDGLETPLDLENLAEEVADLGKTERSALQSYVRNAIEHLLKLEFSSSREPRGGWRIDLFNARQGAADKLTPSLRRRLVSDLPRVYRSARKAAMLNFAAHGETVSLPSTCPYEPDKIFDEDWEPKNRHDIVDTPID